MTRNSRRIYTNPACERNPFPFTTVSDVAEDFDEKYSGKTFQNEKREKIALISIHNTMSIDQSSRK